MAYLGLDIGTSGVKAIVISDSGEILTQKYVEYDQRFPRKGWVEILPLDTWNATKQAIRAVAAAGEEIEAIAAASFGESAVILDGDGNPLCSSIYYTDVRGSDMLDDIRNNVDVDALQLRTGMPLNYMYTLPKLLWINKYHPEILDQAKHILLFGAYIQYMLTGKAVIDRSLASRSLLYNRIGDCWDREVCEVFGIDTALLPEILPAGERIGTIKKALAQELGLASDTVVVSGVHDQVAAALGMGVFHPGEIADGIGSSECFTVPLPENPDYSEMFSHNYCAEPYVQKGSFVTLAFLSTAGSILKWYRETFVPDLAEKCRNENRNIFDILNSALTEKPSPLLLLPYFSGSGTPYMDGNAKAMIYGLSLNTSRQDIYQAIYEGMNFELCLNLELLKKSGFEAKIISAGGGGASLEALKMKSSILQMPIWKLRSRQTGVTGLAMLCMKALGRTECLETAAEQLVKKEMLIEPNLKYASEYSEKYEQFKQMYNASRRII